MLVNFRVVEVMALSRIFGKTKKDVGSISSSNNHQQEDERGDVVNNNVLLPGEQRHGRDRLLYPLQPKIFIGKSQNHFTHPLQGVPFTLSQR